MKLIVCYPYTILYLHNSGRFGLCKNEIAQYSDRYYHCSDLKKNIYFNIFSLNTTVYILGVEMLKVFPYTIDENYRK